MMMQRLFILMFLLGSMLAGQTQKPAVRDTILKPVKDTSSRLFIINADTSGSRSVDSGGEITFMVGKLELLMNGTFFYCDSAVLKEPEKIIEAFGNVHIKDADTVHAYSQYLIYYAKTRQSILKRKVRLTDGKGELLSDELEYNTRSKIGSYNKGGKIINGTTIVTSKEATYYADLNDVYFKKNVKLRDPSNELDSDSLLYNTKTQIATFISKTLIQDTSGVVILTSDGYYDTKNKQARLGKRSVINDGKGVTVTGDDIYTDDKTGITSITGRAVFVDTVQKVSVLANRLNVDKKSNTFLATEHPLMILEQGKDTIYITADTLLSAKTPYRNDSSNIALETDTIKTEKKIGVLTSKDTADIRYFKGYHRVRIFSDSLQAVCDSLLYSANDSVFRMFINPVVWAGNNSQITGDTIYLFTKNKKAERMKVFENALAINKAADNMFNQLRGNTINGYFKDGAIEYMRAKGSAQSIYYAQDEYQAVVGVNNATGDIIDMRFADKELKKVVFIRDVTGTMYPIRQVPEEKKQLRDFKWLEEKRPKTKYELFEEPIQEAIETPTSGK
jgi:lipopolysaccharide export system protein LptA